jgi:hypothetical protein
LATINDPGAYCVSFDVVPPEGLWRLVGWGFETSSVTFNDLSSQTHIALTNDDGPTDEATFVATGDGFGWDAFNFARLNAPSSPGTATGSVEATPTVDGEWSYGPVYVDDNWRIEVVLYAGAATGSTIDVDFGRFYLIWDGDPPADPPATTLGLAPPAIVSAPQLAPAPHGLLQTAVEVSESPEVRLGQEVEAWTAGFQFQPEACDQGGMWVPCIDTKTSDLNPGGSGSGSGDQLKSQFDAPDIEEFIPYWVEGQFTCSTQGFEVAQYAKRARRSLELVTPKQVEHEFWTGDQMAQHPNATNQALVTEVSTRAQIMNAGTIGALTPVSPVQGFALLQQGLANCATGSRGMIHATPYLVELFISNHLVYQDGARLSSVARGTYVVAGAGYPGSGPTIAAGQAAATGTQVWAFATGVVNYRLGRVRLYPNEQDIDADLREAMRPPSNNGEAHGWDNQITYRAERAAAAVWDPCCTVAVLIDVCAESC